MPTSIDEQDRKDLQAAKRLLENPGLAMKIASVIGMPIEKVMEWLPRRAEKMIGEVTRAALGKAAEAAIYTMHDAPGERSSNWWHKLAAAASGAGGGFFGVAGLPVELPVSITIILRSIADIARSEGFSLQSQETRAQCIAVLALGGRGVADDAADAGYLAARAGLAQAISEGGAKLITSVAARLSVQVSEKVAGQAVPVIGAASGAVINTLFIGHFQDMARGHFTYLRLVGKYGHDVVDALYEELPAIA